MPDAKSAADPQQPGRRRHRPATKKRCCGSISGCGRAIRRSWKRPGRCSTRSSSTPIAIGWAGRPLPHQSQVRAERARNGNDAAAGGLDRRHQVRAASCASGEPGVEIDDIDHLGNRRLRTIDELAGDELRKGFLKLRRTVQERMSLKDVEDMTPRSLINPKSISAAIEYFFGRGELSQVVDQTNPLSMLTHERRLVGPWARRFEPQAGRLRSARRAYFALRPHLPDRNAGRHEHRSDLQPGHLRRRRRIRLPGHAVPQGEQGQADRRSRLAAGRPGDAKPIWRRPMRRSRTAHLQGDTIIARYRGDFELVPIDKVQYIDVAPSQMVGVSAGLIPFLEHDDANRALMGSNMQRQAVPLLVTEPPIVATGMEVRRGPELRHGRAGAARRAPSPMSTPTASRSATTVYPLRKFVGLNERTCLNQKPIVEVGAEGRKGRGHRRRRRHLQRRAGPGPQRAGRLHGLGRLQLRGRHHHQRRAGEERHLHLDSHRRIRHRNPRDEAGPRRVHARHSQRQRKGAAQSRRGRHRPHRHLRAAGRHPGRQGLAEVARPN